MIDVWTRLIASDEGERSAVELTVCDTGPGLQGRSLDDLCAAFFSTKRDGMGLGLGICRSIVEQHGGRLAATDHPDGGACISFTLPVAVSMHDAGARMNPTIFVVDDEPDVRNAVAFALRQSGHTVRTFADGHELLSEVDSLLPELRAIFVLDVRMEPMSGPALHDALIARGLRERSAGAAS